MMPGPGCLGFPLLIGRRGGLVGSLSWLGGACDGGLSAIRVAGEDTTIDDEVDARPGCQRGHAFEELAGLEEDVRGAVGPSARLRANPLGKPYFVSTPAIRSWNGGSFHGR